MAYTFQFSTRQQAKSNTPDKIEVDPRAVNPFYAAMRIVEEFEDNEIKLQLSQKQVRSLKVTG